MTTPWLTETQLRAWVKLQAVVEMLPGVLETQLRADSGMSHFEYLVLAMLSETSDHTLRMSTLARRTSATLPRLSHVVKRLEDRGYVSRSASRADRRANNAHLTQTGYEALVAAAPGHVRRVRSSVIDALTDDQVDQLDAIMSAILDRIDTDGRLKELPGQ